MCINTYLSNAIHFCVVGNTSKQLIDYRYVVQCIQSITDTLYNYVLYMY
jgi:hypothetical protein